MKTKNCNHKRHWVKNGKCESCGGKMCEPPFGESCPNELVFVSCCTEKYVCSKCYDDKRLCVCKVNN